MSSTPGRPRPDRPARRGGGRGSYFWDYDGKRYLDFSSQLVNTNIGHQHPKVVAAIQEQAARLCTLAPGFAVDVRSEAARLIAERTPGDLDKIFFTNGGAEAVENAVRMARLHTGRAKVLSTYRSYHGATAAAINLTGDPRRWPSDTAAAGVVHFWGPYLYRSAFHATTEPRSASARSPTSPTPSPSRARSPSPRSSWRPCPAPRGSWSRPPATSRASASSATATASSSSSTRSWPASAARTWFAAEHWGVTPDLITFAKGVNSGYVPLGGVAISGAIAETFATRPYPGGLTYSGHPLACAAAVATINAMEEEDVVGHAARLGEHVLGPGLAELAERHPSVGEVRGLGAFWALELVRDKETREPLVPYNAAGEANAPMAEFAAACKASGLWPFVNMNRTHVVPPCTVTERRPRRAWPCSTRR